MKSLLLIATLFYLRAEASPWVQNIALPSQFPVESLIYGNAELGFFELKVSETEQKQRKLSFTPPSHQKSIMLAWKSKQKLKYQCSSRAFAAPGDPLLDSGKFTTKGKPFSVPFVLMNAYVGTKKSGVGLVYIVNKLGEIVWSHRPPPPTQPSDDVRTLTLTVKPFERGLYAILRPYDQSYFEIIDIEERVQTAIDPHTSKSPYPIHHDFILKDKNTLLSLGHTKVFAKKWWKFWSKPISFLSIPLLEINLKTNEALSLWNYLGRKNPFHEIDWSFNAEDSGSFWYLWGEENAENNFEHINSIQKVGEEGYLLSLRSLNKLVFLSPNFQKILWTVGKHPKNTYSPGSADADFYRQHHVSLLGNQTILLFDNGKTRSRILKLRLNPSLHTTELLHSYEPEKPYFSIRHGSAYVLANQNVFGFFPNTVPERAGPNYIYEFDKDSTKVNAEMSVDFGLNRVAFRAIPLTEIGRETYLGSQNPTPCQP